MVYDIQDYSKNTEEHWCSSVFLEYRTMDKVQKPNSPEFRVDTTGLSHITCG
jgi:hypothetical protein